MTDKRAIIIGGGLAGMTVAKALLEHCVKVVILEASDRMGGKAGAVQRDGMWEDHGYHVFPGWYLNARQLLKDLGIASDLIDIEKFYHLAPPADDGTPARPFGQRLHAFYPISSPRMFMRNVFSGLLPWPESMLSFYFMADLTAESLSSSGFLDRISPNGFLRSRFYATENIAKLHQDTVLQASAIPNYEVSAKTIQNLGRYWLKTPLPMFSIFNGNLQEKFIQPFERHIRASGCEIRFERRVEGLTMTGDRVASAWSTQITGDEHVGDSNDIFVIASPRRGPRDSSPNSSIQRRHSLRSPVYAPRPWPLFICTSSAGCRASPGNT